MKTCSFALARNLVTDEVTFPDTNKLTSLRDEQMGVGIGMSATPCVVFSILRVLQQRPLERTKEKDGWSVLNATNTFLFIIG